jgi:tryptophan synthase alpha subunit
MSKLNRAVKAANDRGDLALMIYVIPNYPDPETYAKTLAVLNASPYVSIIEMTLPVTSAFSDFANETIREAHKRAASFGHGAELAGSLMPFEKPAICVLYQELYERLGYDALLRKLEGKVDGVTFEWIVPDLKAHAYSYDRFGVELIVCADPKMTDAELVHDLSLSVEEPVIYLTSAPMTGAKMYAEGEIATCVQKVRALRPKAKILAGFGVRCADDVAMLARIEGLDGAIVGTAFLEAMGGGAEAAAAFLDALTPALAGARQP